MSNAASSGQKTVVFIKPATCFADAQDGQDRQGRIERAIQEAGFYITGRREAVLTQTQAREMYDNVFQVHPSLAWEIVYVMTRGPGVALLVEGPSAVERVRSMVGATDPRKAEPGTLRALAGPFPGGPCNGVHVPENAQEAAHLMALWFPQSP